MREFTEKEKNWIKEFVEIKRKGLSHILELQVAKLLRTNFTFFALKWNYGDKPQVSLYDKDKDEDKSEKQYYNICDFIYFIKELENLGFIVVQKISADKNDAENSILYDRDKYSYNKEKNTFELKNKPDYDIDSLTLPYHIQEEISPNVHGLSPIHTQNINLDFANDLHRYGLGIIYPLPLAEDYVDNGFTTLEERYHDSEMKVALNSAAESRKAAKIASWSFIVAIISLAVSIVIPMCTSQKIDSDQINTLKTAIQNNKIDEPINVEIKDTILTKPVSISSK